MPRMSRTLWPSCDSSNVRAIALVGLARSCSFPESDPRPLKTTQRIEYVGWVSLHLETDEFVRADAQALDVEMAPYSAAPSVVYCVAR